MRNLLIRSRDVVRSLPGWRGNSDPAGLLQEKTRPAPEKRGRERLPFVPQGRPTNAGQSMVELALFFPVLLMLLSGVVEFGFLLNQYLNLIDGPREGARFAVTQNPFIGGVGTDDNPCFYSDIAAEVIKALNPVSAQYSLFHLDPTRDDVVISVFTINNNAVVRYPSNANLQLPNPNICPAGAPPESTIDNTTGEWHLYGQGLGNGCNVDTDITCHPSRFTSADVLARVTQTNGGAIPPSMGVIMVEVFYGYNQVLKLPWLAFVGDPIRLYSFTMMPLPAAAPATSP